MKVLWLTAVHVPAVSNKLGKPNANTGGWIQTGLNLIEPMTEIESIAIVTVYKGQNLIRFIRDKVHYYIVPSRDGIFNYDVALKKYLKNIVEEFQPDIIDIHGSEFFLGRSILETCDTNRTCITLQGLSSEIDYWYYAGLSVSDLFFSRTIKDNLLLDGLMERKLRMKKRGRNEIKLLKKVKFVIGRTEWDKANSKKHNTDLHYFSCDRVLRDSFYKTTWELDSMRRHTIFTIQSTYPIKGLHLLLGAVKMLIGEYPDLMLFIPGKNLLQKKSLYQKASFGSYQKHIRRLIEKYSLDNHVMFLGTLNDAQVANQLKTSNVFVLPSIIENSPNSLAEAQLVGTPCIASYVGGVPDMVQDGVSGLLYNGFEMAILAEKIRQIFNSDDLAEYLSTNGKRLALLRHNPDKVRQKLIEAYRVISAR